MTEEQRKYKREFIKRQFKDKVSDEELDGSDEQIEKLYKEAESYSDWGL